MTKDGLPTPSGSLLPRGRRVRVEDNLARDCLRRAEFCRAERIHKFGPPPDALRSASASSTTEEAKREITSRRVARRILLRRKNSRIWSSTRRAWKRVGLLPRRRRRRGNYSWRVARRILLRRKNSQIWSSTRRARKRVGLLPEGGGKEGYYFVRSRSWRAAPAKKLRAMNERSAAAIASRSSAFRVIASVSDGFAFNAVSASARARFS